MNLWWVVKTVSWLPARFSDHGHALDYASHVHGILEGPMSSDQAEALIRSWQRTLLDGASPMEAH